MVNRNLEQCKEDGTPVPGYDPDFGYRLKWVINKIGTQKRAAEIVGVKPEMIGKYVAGRAKPSFYTIRALANAAKVKIDWLAAGGEQINTTPHQHLQTIDQKLMGRCSDAFGKLYKELGISLSLDDLGQLAAEAYNDVVTTTQDPDEQRIVIKGLASRHRRELLTETTANTSGKRTAS